MRSLRARVALAAVAAAAIVVTVAAGVLIATAGRDERNDLDAQLERRARAVARPPLFAGPGDELLSGSNELVRVFRAGAAVGEFGEGPEEGELPPPAAPGFETFEVADETWRSYTLRPPRPAAVQVATSLEPLERRVAARRRGIVLVGLGALAAAGGLGLAFGGVALRPLRRLREAAARVGTTRDLHARVPAGDGPEEVEALAESLNAMLARLEASSADTEAALRASRRFAADAGHELRTPLTSITANLDALARNPDMPAEDRRRALQGLRSELSRLSEVLDALQELARGDAGAGQPLEEVDLTELAEAAAASVRSRHPGLELSLAETNGPVRFVGSPAGLRLVLDNLLENAAVHGGERVELRVEPGAHGGARVMVDDDGPGIPERERGQVLQRFTRGSRAQGRGSGLGLAIVSQQAALHGGSVCIEDSPLGGARFRVELSK